MGYDEWRQVFRRWTPRVDVFTDGHSPRWRLRFESVDLMALDDALFDDDTPLDHPAVEAWHAASTGLMRANGAAILGQLGCQLPQDSPRTLRLPIVIEPAKGVIAM